MAKVQDTQSSTARARETYGSVLDSSTTWEKWAKTESIRFFKEARRKNKQSDAWVRWSITKYGCLRHNTWRNVYEPMNTNRNSESLASITWQDWLMCQRTCKLRVGVYWMESQVQKMGKSFSGSGATAKRAEIYALIERQGFRCALTGVPLSPEEAELDHIVPASNGGGNLIGNLQVVHKTINRMKGSMDNDEFIQWCQSVASVNSVPPPHFGSSCSISHV